MINPKNRRTDNENIQTHTEDCGSRRAGVRILDQQPDGGHGTGHPHGAAAGGTEHRGAARHGAAGRNEE